MTFRLPFTFAPSGTAAMALVLGLLPWCAEAAITPTGDTFVAPSSPDTWVGVGANGTFQIDGGSDYITDALLIGRNAGGNGTMTLTGSGSTIITNKSVSVGLVGNAALNILAGGVLTSNGMPNSPTFYNVTIGNSTTGNGQGTVTVDGDGSKWIIPNLGINISSTSSTSAGTLTVNHGGSISVGGGITIAPRGKLRVTGTDPITHAASTITSGSLRLDSNAPDAVVISAGGILNSGGSCYIGSVPGRAGAVTVTGSGSQWNVVGAVNLGLSSAEGSITVADGALVSISSTGSASGTGNGLLSLGGSPNSSNPGTPSSVGNLYVGTGGAAGRLNMAEINGFYSTSTNPPMVPAISTIVLNHNENAYEFKNTAGNGILVSGSTKVVNQAGTTIFTAANTYRGGTQVTGGKLIVNNTTGIGTGSGTVNVSGTGQLGGRGMVGAVVVGSGGSTYPGDPQTLTVASVHYQSGSTAQFAVETNTNATPTAGGDYDRIAVSGGGALNIDAGAVLQLNLTSDALTYLQTQAEGSTPANYFLFTLGSGSSTGAFDQLTLTEGGNTYTQSIVGGEAVFSELGLEIQIGYTGNALTNSLTGGRDLTFTAIAVPEPASVALLLIAGMSGVAFRRRG